MATEGLLLKTGRINRRPPGKHPLSPVLVMDDEEPIRSLAASMLDHLGCCVTTCASGEEAIASYKKAKDSGEPFQSVIMDLTVIDGMGGKEAAQRILLDDPEACLIVSSGYSNDPIMTDHSRYGFRALLAKPYKLDDLTEVLDNLINDHCPPYQNVPLDASPTDNPATQATTQPPLTRDELAVGLLAAGQIGSCIDYCEVARHLQCHCSKESILSMEELNRWPAARTWLQARL